MRHLFKSRIRQVAQQANNDRADQKQGLITSSDPTTHAVKINLQPENKETGWIPYGCHVWGNGFGVFALPSNTAQITVDHEQGHPEAGVAQHSVCDDNNLPPKGLQATEFWCCHPTGSLIKVTNDKNVTVHAAQDILATSVRDTDTTAQRDVNITAVRDVTIVAGRNINITAADLITLTAPEVIINGNLVVNGFITATGTITPNV